MMRKIVLALITLALLQACSTTPSIQTHHRTIPSKKNEYSKKDSTYSSPAPSIITALPVAATTAPPVIIKPIENFNLSEEVKEKPRSSVSYDSDAKKIGVILPMTGKNANLGQRALNAIRLGLGIEEKGSFFSVAIYDSQSNPDLAAQGVEKLLRDDHVVAILGGLSSKEAQGISAKAEFFQVPFFSFSQKSGLTDNSDYTFRNSITPEMQVARLLQYAFKNLNAKRFAILYPNDPYGVEFANKYWDLVLAGGGEIVAAQTYDPKETNLNLYVQKLVNTYHTEARLQEYKNRIKEIADKNKKKKEKEKESTSKKKSVRDSEAEENILPAIVDFDVLFVPDSGKALGQVMAFMKNNDVTELTYLGTNLWNTPDLSRRVSGNNNVIFVDASFSTEEQIKSDFHNKYLAKYEEAPTLVEAQIYEAAKILHDVIGSSSISRSSLAYQLNILGRRTGAYNEIRMNNNHEIERPLHIFGLVEGSIQKTE